MRIITGKAKGLKLTAPAGLDVRPTADRVKESLFNILGNQLFDANVLDLFSGSGNLGLEAYSRGAKKVVFVDSSKLSISFLKKNVTRAKADSYVKIYLNDAVKSIGLLAEQGFVFDIIFCDPPYNKGLEKLIIKELAKSSLLSQDGILVLEHSSKDTLASNAKLVVYRVEKYGNTHLTFLKWDLKEELSEKSNLSGEL